MVKQAAEYRKKTTEEGGKQALLEQVTKLKEELSSLRTAQVTNGASSKLNKIKGVRKNIARLLTVLNQSSRASSRAKFSKLSNDRLPKDLRVKKTRAIRRRLTVSNTHVLASAGPKGAAPKRMVPRLTVKQAKKVSNTKKQPYAVLPESQ